MQTHMSHILSYSKTTVYGRELWQIINVTHCGNNNRPSMHCVNVISCVKKAYNFKYKYII